MTCGLFIEELEIYCVKNVQLAGKS